MNPDCLSERDLILLHYHEPSDGTTPEGAAAHLATCADCRARRERLARDLARIPLGADPDPLATTRIIARVSERLQEKRRWLPSLGGVAAAALALLVILFARSPQPEAPPPPPAGSPTVAALDLDDEMIDVDFLEDLELIRNLELLQQLQGG